MIGGRLGLLLLFAVASVGAATMAVYHTPNWDYQCYVNAAALLDLGRSQYSNELGTQHIYPPPIAHVFLLARRVLPSDASVFWVYQAIQLGLLAAAQVLIATLFARLGLRRERAAMLSAFLLIVNAPIFYTLQAQNPNLVLLDAALAAMLFPRSAAAGLALAAATLLKLYPAVLIVPLWWFGYRRIALWWAAGVLLPFLSGRVRDDLPAFLALLPDMPKGEAILDNSVASLVERGARLFGIEVSRAAATLAGAGAGGSALCLVAWRLLRGTRFLRACAELTAAVLLISPIAWPEHFVLALPLAAVTLSNPIWRPAAIVAALLVFALPRSAMYFAGHHFLFGALLMLAVSMRQGASEPPSPASTNGRRSSRAVVETE